MPIFIFYKSTVVRKLLVLVLLQGFFWNQAMASDQKTTLGKSEAPRFEVKDRLWPEKIGEASICLWKDDKLAAFSVTIDDNSAPDHSWWTEIGARYDWRFTWFIITGIVGDRGHGGTWDGFAALNTLGHDVQSHSVTHLSVKRGFTDIETEYRDSVQQLREHISLKKGITLAYPGGNNEEYNDESVAEKYYIAARGTVGLINSANTINYMKTASVSGTIYIDPPKAVWADFRAILDPSINNGRSYRGWYCTHFHTVKTDKRAELVEAFDYIKEREKDVWVGLFREVVTYGQQRDTATLEISRSAGKEYRLLLTDNMDDELFDFPLTVKVRLPKGTTQVVTRQQQQINKAHVIEHDEGVYALVDVIPDRGELLLKYR